MTQLLRLSQNCLMFDFIGTSTDESSDDLCTVQIPTAWRPAFLDTSTLTLFFDLYAALPYSLSSLVSGSLRVACPSPIAGVSLHVALLRLAQIYIRLNTSSECALFMNMCPTLSRPLIS